MDASCEHCGFLPADYRERDLATAAKWLRTMADQTIEGVADEVTATGEVAETLAALDATLATLGPARESGPTDPAAVHEGIHRVRALGRHLHAASAGVPSHEGVVDRISISDGGVPKSAVDAADIGPRGLLGDRQANRKHHGRPFQAVCLWSSDVIDALRAEGHPVHAGAAGENITVQGLDWAALRPGTRLLAGEVLCELSAWAEPCRKNDQWFLDRSDRILHDLHPGWSRIYAWVLEPGSVAVGDAVVVEP